MGDLTIIFLTVNRVPKQWAAYHLDVLKKAIGKASVISITKEPMDFGLNIIQDEPEGAANIYRQMLRAAKIADTPFLAMAEDDTLYSPEHFNMFRPPLDTFAYNMNRWSIFTWGEPMYSLRYRKSNCSAILPRVATIEALEERFAKFPNGMPDKLAGEIGRGMVERNLGVTVRKTVEWYSYEPVVQFNHDFGIDHLQTSHRKRHSPVRAFDIPYWGKAAELVKRFN